MPPMPPAGAALVAVAAGRQVARRDDVVDFSTRFAASAAEAIAACSFA